MTSKAPLTLDHLYDALGDERHHGWGYAGRDGLSTSRRERLDRAVVAVANELGLTREELFHWTDSKCGRWLIDAASGSNPTKALVRGHLNAEAIRSLAMERSS